MNGRNKARLCVCTGLSSHQAHFTLCCFGSAGKSGWVDYKEYESAKGKEQVLVIARNKRVPMMRDPELLDDTIVQLSIVGSLFGIIFSMHS